MIYLSRERKEDEQSTSASSDHINAATCGNSIPSLNVDYEAIRYQINRQALNMKTSSLVLLLFLLASSSLNAQESPVLLPGELWRESNRYYQGRDEISHIQFTQLLDRHPDAGPYFQKGKLQLTSGNILAFGGGFLGLGALFVTATGSLSETETREDNRSLGYLAAAGGLSALITGVILIRAGRRNVEQAIDTYNRVEVDEKLIRLTLQPNQIGLRITFGR